MDYLIEEVLKRQSADVQDFLLQTSVLERLTAPLCDSLTGRRDSQDMLSKLERANLFTVPLDESRQWYRYHHLFAELLQHRLEVVRGAEEAPLLHQRASQWYEDNHFPDDAIHHALAARDWERAMRLIYAQSMARMNRGEFKTLFSWFHVVPEEVLRTHPRLYSQFAQVIINVGKFDEVEAALSHLERMAQGDAGLQGELAVHRMALARIRGDVTRTVEFAERALALLPPDAFALRAGTSFVLGLVQYFGARLDEARSLMTDAYEMGRRAGNYWIGAGGASFLTQILWLRGRLRQALNMGQQAVELAGQSLAAATPR
jgi:LuxR family transcriptional regulator, maltose regulon positive regulatory protein